MDRNRLADETSPYLRQHKDNPVHWQAWGPEALAAARDQDKPILLSVGYAACHWCHVMAHESFEDPEIAKLMNEYFINIKVDREERPDVDNIYQHALAMMGEHGGWPLTMFLTPAGEPFWGGTYFPPTPRYGRPGFPQVLESLADTYKNEPTKITDNAGRMRKALTALSVPSGGGQLSAAMIDDAATHMLRHVDPIAGGTHGAPKFPQGTFFSTLWRAYVRTGGSMFRESVALTMNNICQGGIYDHLGGGIARYSVDGEWLVPHFEKMLYDNAQFVDLLSQMYPTTNSTLYAERVSETVAWLLSDMRSATDGPFAFVSAYDADSEGEEGKYYVWRAEEIADCLGEDAPRFSAAYDVSPYGNWEGKTILNRSADPDYGDPTLEPLLAHCRETLLARRATRVPPERDDKVLADWNGLTITALVRAAAVFDRPDWLNVAREVFDFILKNLSSGARLHHTWCQGRAAHPGVLTDYAEMSRAALALYQSTDDATYLDHATTWTDAANKYFWDATNGGYFLSAVDTEDLLTRTKPVQDDATPAGNGTMADVLARLHHLTGDPAYREHAERLTTALAATELGHLVHQPGLVSAFEVLTRAVQVVVAGEGPAAGALVQTALSTAHPRLILQRTDDQRALPETHPAAGKATIKGQAAAYLCIGQSCTLPITDPNDLKSQLLAAQ